MFPLKSIRTLLIQMAWTRHKTKRSKILRQGKRNLEIRGGNPLVTFIKTMTTLNIKILSENI